MLHSFKKLRLNIDFPIAFEQNLVTSIAYELF